MTLDGLEGELRVSGEQACIVLRDLPAPGEASAPPRRAFAYGAYWLDGVRGGQLADRPPAAADSGGFSRARSRRSARHGAQCFARS